jgi:hypothetical protein
MDNFHINGPYDIRNLALNQQQSTEEIGKTAQIQTDQPASSSIGMNGSLLGERAAEA